MEYEILHIKVIQFPMRSDGFFQFSKNGTNMQIAIETIGKHTIFQNQAALVNRNLKKMTLAARSTRINIPNARNSLLLDMTNSL